MEILQRSAGFGVPADRLCQNSVIKPAPPRREILKSASRDTLEDPPGKSRVKVEMTGQNSFGQRFVYQTIEERE